MRTSGSRCCPAPPSGYTLDPLGRRIIASATGPWRYDSQGRLTEAGALRYQYDAAGRATQKSTATTTLRFAYDAFDRLIEVRDGAEQLLARYRYDPFDRRLWKDQGSRTVYLNGAEGPLAETDATGTLQRRYVWRPNRPWASDPVAIHSEAGTAYLHNDHQGQPLRATDASGTLIWAAEPRAFGGVRLTLNRLEQPLRLAGQLEDPESGLHYNLRRHYDPATGRYLQPDPLGLAGGDEPYVYAEHDPLNKIDPTGEAAFLIPLGLNYGRCFVGCLALGALMGGGGGGGGWGCGAPPGLAGDCGLECLKPWNWGPRLPKGPRRPPPKPKPTPEPPCPCNSFPGDTLVHTPDGLRPIAKLKAGDPVIAKAEWSGEERTELIEQVMSGEREVLLVHLTLATGEKITATANHPLRTAEGWRDAQLIKAGGQLDLKGSTDERPKRAEVVKVEHELKRERVYNLEVANAHTFFVGEEGVWGHNAKGPGGVYCFLKHRGRGDSPYAGQSVDMARRARQHERSDSRWGIDPIFRWPSTDEYTKRVWEQYLIDGFRENGSCANINNAPRPRKK